MSKKKSLPGGSIRNFWSIKPMTRVHDNDIRKNPAKGRQASKQVVRQAMNEIENQNKNASRTREAYLLL